MIIKKFNENGWYDINDKISILKNYIDNIPPWSFEIIKEDTLNEYNRNLKINNIIKKFDKFDK